MNKPHEGSTPTNVSRVLPAIAGLFFTVGLHCASEESGDPAGATPKEAEDAGVTTRDGTQDGSTLETERLPGTVAEGTRLKAVYREEGYADGARIRSFDHFYDTTLATSCWVRGVGSDTYRCLPVEATRFFEDAQCTSELAAVYRGPETDKSEPTMVSFLQAGCEPRPTVVRVAKPAVVPTTVFERTSTGCQQERVLADSSYHRVERAVSPAEIAEFRRETEKRVLASEAHGARLRIYRQTLRSGDGASLSGSFVRNTNYLLPDGIVQLLPQTIDTARSNAWVAPTRTSDLMFRALPESGKHVNAVPVFSDAQCRDPVAGVFGVAQCPRVDADSAQDATRSGPTTAGCYTNDAITVPSQTPLAATFRLNGEGVCSPAGGGSSSSSVAFFPLGSVASIANASFAELLVTLEPITDLLATNGSEVDIVEAVVRSPDGLVERRNRLFVDKKSRLPCYNAGNRCIPSGRTLADGRAFVHFAEYRDAFLDAECTQPAVAISASCSADAPSPFAVDLSGAEAIVVQRPSVPPLPASQRIYFKSGSSCTLRPVNARNPIDVYPASAAVVVPLATFPEAVAARYLPKF